MQKQLQAFMKSHFHSFPTLLKTPLISRLMTYTTVHPPQAWPTPRPVGENGMGEPWGFGAGLEALPSWLPTPLGLNFPSLMTTPHFPYDAWGCTHSLKDSLALYKAFIETKMDSGRWGHSMTLSFSSASACVPHYTCLPPPMSDATVILPSQFTFWKVSETEATLLPQRLEAQAPPDIPKSRAHFSEWQSDPVIHWLKTLPIMQNKTHSTPGP